MEKIAIFPGSFDPFTKGHESLLRRGLTLFRSTGGSTWSAVGWYGALLSAHAYTGAVAGFGYLNANYRSSNAGAYFGFRLCRF